MPEDIGRDRLDLGTLYCGGEPAIGRLRRRKISTVAVRRDEVCPILALALNGGLVEHELGTGTESAWYSRHRDAVAGF
jgi:hypothetical protein